MEHENRADLQPEKKKIGTWHAFGKVMISPSATFTRLVAAPRTWGPMLCQAIIALLVFFPSYGKYQEYYQILLEKTIPADQLDIVSLETLTSTTMISTIVTLPIVVFLTPLIYAALLKILNFVMGKEAKFRNIWMITIFSYVPLLLGMLVANVLLFTASEEDLLFTVVAKTSLAVFLPHTVSPLLFTFCASLDIFSIWNVALVAVGASQLFKVKFVKMASILFGIWLAYIFITALIGQGSISQVLG